MDAVKEFKAHALNPEHPVTRGTAQNPDIFFQLVKLVTHITMLFLVSLKNTWAKSASLLGRDYKLFNYYGAPDAEEIIVAMGSICECIAETIDYLVAQGKKVGLLNVHLYRPFATESS